MLGQMASIAGRTRRGSRSTATRRRRARRSTRCTRPIPTRTGRRSAPPRCTRATRWCVLDDEEAERLLAERPAPPGRERGAADRDVQGGDRPARVRRPLRAGRHRRLARPRPYADGDGVEGDHRRRAPVLHRARPLPRPQRLALQPQPAAPAAAPRGHRASRRRTTRRSPPASSPGGCARATRSRPRSSAASTELDGFYTFAVGTADGFAVLRDPIACKPAVMAETDEWVAMASEYRAIAVLPGAEEARVWEPAPAKVYVWERERRSHDGRGGGRDGRSRVGPRCASSTRACTRRTSRRAGG